MNSQTNLQSARASDALGIRFVDVGHFEEQLKRFSEVIAQRAYQIYERRDREDGNALEDWCRAETEIGRLVPVGMFEHPCELEINVRLLGCSTQEIEACLESRRLLIRARKKTDETRASTGAADSKLHFDGIFLALNLSQQIDPDKASVNFGNGDLCLRLPKVAAQPYG